MAAHEQEEDLSQPKEVGMVAPAPASSKKSPHSWLCPSRCWHTRWYFQAYIMGSTKSSDLGILIIKGLKTTNMDCKKQINKI